MWHFQTRTDEGCYSPMRKLPEKLDLLDQVLKDSFWQHGVVAFQLLDGNLSTIVNAAIDLSKLSGLHLLRKSQIVVRDRLQSELLGQVILWYALMLLGVTMI